MTGNSQTPRVVRYAPLSNPYLLGPLSRMMLAPTGDSTLCAPIKAIWRNEQGPAEVSTGQVNP